MNSEKKTKEVFMEIFKGLPTYDVAVAVSGHGVNYAGCSKSAIAEYWVDTDHGIAYRTKDNLCEIAEKLKIKKAKKNKMKMLESVNCKELLSEAIELIRINRQGAGITESLKNCKDMDNFLGKFGITGNDSNEGGGIPIKI